MDDAWNTLVAAGVPDGAVRAPAGQPEGSRVREALEAVASELSELSLRDREVLLAWLSAYSHHWPTAFTRTLGPAGEATLQALGREPIDPNRYLKLRRIAIENLAGAR